MRRLAMFLAILFVFSAARGAGAQEYPERWVLGYGKSLAEREDVEDFIALIKEAKRLGYTHIVFDEVYNQALRGMPQKYFDHIAMARKAAEDAGIIIVPGIFSVGYSWRVIWYDSNLAAGLPVRDAAFVVKNGAASADPQAVPALVNGGFEAAQEGETPSWAPQDGAEVSVSFDAEQKRSGGSALKMSDFDKLPAPPAPEGARRRQRASCYVKQTLSVDPFKYYRLTIWRKTQGLEAGGSSVNIAATDGKRRLCYTNFEIDPEADWEDFVTADSDWRQFQLTFNTLESTSIDISIGVSGPREGALWWDDIKLEPAGLANLLRGTTKPFVVKNADGSVTYEEGRDFIYVEDPLMGKSPMPAWLAYLKPGGSFDIWHEGPKIRLTPKSAIKEGDRVLVSYYHPHIVYGHQVVGSLTDPKIFEIFEEQMKYAVKVWNAPAYFMGYDEIRAGGWEKQPGGTEYKVAKLLADHVSRAVEIARKHAPDAKLYIWSDMFDPNHNARKIENGHGYYLCNGDFNGSWEGLPSEVGIIYWARGSREALKFFADRGHRIVVSGGNRGRVESTRKEAEGMPELVGFMYTNWQGDYSGLEDYMKAIEAPAQTEE